MNKDTEKKITQDTADVYERKKPEPKPSVKTENDEEAESPGRRFKLLRKIKKIR